VKSRSRIITWVTGVAVSSPPPWLPRWPPAARPRRARAGSASPRSLRRYHRRPAARAASRIGLVTAQPQGPVRYLAAALERRSRAVPGPFTVGEQDALAAVEGKLPREMPVEARNRLLDAAVAMCVAVGSPRDPGFGSAANLLDGTVVPPRSGTKAVRALRDAFHQQAASGAGSCLNDWVQVLADAGLQVYADAGGPAGPRRRAELDAVAAYPARLAARDGILTYSCWPMTYRR
jgi:hypothetical protein